MVTKERPRARREIHPRDREHLIRTYDAPTGVIDALDSLAQVFGTKPYRDEFIVYPGRNQPATADVVAVLKQAYQAGRTDGEHSTGQHTNHNAARILRLADALQVAERHQSFDAAVTIRYAGYWERHHKQTLAISQEDELPIEYRVRKTSGDLTAGIAGWAYLLWGDYLMTDPLSAAVRYARRILRLNGAQAAALFGTRTEPDGSRITGDRAGWPIPAGPTGRQRPNRKRSRKTKPARPAAAARRSHPL